MRSHRMLFVCIFTTGGPVNKAADLPIRRNTAVDTRASKYHASILKSRYSAILRLPLTPLTADPLLRLHLSRCYCCRLHIRAALTPPITMQRLVQLSQANAKLSSESTSARAQLVGAEEASEKAKQDLEVGRQRGEESK